MIIIVGATQYGSNLHEATQFCSVTLILHVEIVVPGPHIPSCYRIFQVLLLLSSWYAYVYITLFMYICWCSKHIELSWDNETC